MNLLALLGQIKWAGAFLGVIGFSLFSFIPFGGGEYKLTAPFDTAAGMYPGSDVLIAGSKAGSVQDIQVRGNYALVTFTVDSAHAPVYENATVAERPKSLLGEKYIALDPGNQGRTLASGTVLKTSQVTRAVELEEILNSVDQPTREKLRTLVLELGGGLAGQGQNTNETLTYGTSDMNDMAAIAQTLANRDQQIQEVLQSLDAVMAELSRSDRRDQLGQLIVNTQRMMKTLADEDGRLQAALVNANSALSRSSVALNGTAPNLAHIMNTLPSLVHNAHLLTSDFGTGLDTLLQPCSNGNSGKYCNEWQPQANPGNKNGSPNSLFTELLTGIDEGPVVFGGRDAQGYATRVAIIVDANSTGGSGKPLNCDNFSGAAKQACQILSGKLLTGNSVPAAAPNSVATYAVPLDGPVADGSGGPTDSALYDYLAGSLK